MQRMGGNSLKNSKHGLHSLVIIIKFLYDRIVPFGLIT